MADMILCIKRQKKLGGRTNKAMRTFGIEDNQGNIIIDHQGALRIWEKYIYKISMI